MSKYDGRVITATPPSTNGTDYSGTASGIWEIETCTYAKSALKWPKGSVLPTVPAIGTIVLTNNVATIPLIPPADMGSLAPLSYNLYCSDGRKFTSTTSPFTVPLNVNQVYSFNLDITNITGTGPTYIGSNVMQLGTPVIAEPAEYTSAVSLLLKFDNDVAALTDPYSSYVQLLLSGTNPTYDCSDTHKAITTFGTITATSAVTAKYYSTSLGVFSGSNYLLTATDNSFYIGTQPFCIEAWVYVTSTGYWNMVSSRGGGMYDGVVINLSTNTNAGISQLLIADTVSNWAVNNGGGTLPLNVWTHVACTRIGTLHTGYINGTAVFTSTTAVTVNVYQNGYKFYIGYDGGTVGNGYMSDVRITIGAQRYSGNFTPPVAGLAATLYDNSPAANAIRANNNQAYVLSTVDKMMGTKSLSITANTTNYLIVNDSTALNLSGWTYTIECWIKPTATYYTAINTIIAKRAIGTTNTAWQVYLDAVTGNLSFRTGTTDYVSSTAPINNTWNHIAAVYDGTKINLYVNGVQVLSQTATNIDVASNVYIGGYATLQKYVGLLDHVKITKDARYTNNFTPIADNAVYGDTTALVPFNTYDTNTSGLTTTYTVTSTPGNITATGTSSPITVTGLTNGTPYTFKVTASNAYGYSMASSASAITIPAKAPEQPTIGAAVYGYQSATVEFTAPASNGDSITNYIVTSTPGNVTGTGTTSPITVSGLTNNVSYTFTIQAVNKAGRSIASTSSNSIIPGRPPSAPSISSAVFGNQTATITFTLSDNGGVPVNYYTIYCSDGTNQQLTGSTITPFVYTGLTNGTSYTFTVKATNDKGTSLVSNTSAVVIPATVPSAPTVGTVTTSGSGVVSIPFTYSTDNNGDAISSYTATSSPGNITASSATTPIQMTGLDVGTTYTFTVKANNKAGASIASNVSNSIRPALAPTAPTNVVAEYGYNQSVNITFTGSADNGGYAPTYTVVSSPGGFTASGSASPLMVTGLTNNTAYTFNITASNTIGSSSTVTSNSATPGVPSAPTNAVVSYPSRTSASIAFTASARNGGSAITGYTLTRSDGATVTGTTSPLVMSNNFINGTNYTFTVTATNAVGSSPVSNSTVSGAPNLTITIQYTTPVSNAVVSDTEIRAVANTLNWNGSTAITANITNSTTITSTSTAVAALSIANITGGTLVTFVNNGNIVGRGGDGGGGGGGVGLYVGYTTTVTNNGTIGGGGGGGGIGETSYGIINWAGAGSGGGGGGGGGGLGKPGKPPQPGYNVGYSGADGTTFNGGKGGNGGNGWNGTTQVAGAQYCNDGVAGGSTAGGTGGAGGNKGLPGTAPGESTSYGSWGGGGGGGGGIGNSGGAGGGSAAAGSRWYYYNGGAGGAAGAAVSGNANITWLATGNRYGTVA